MPADTSDIFDLATIATELKNESLYHACQQVVEHDTTDYWILQFQSLRLAMQKQDEEYAALSRDQVSAETMARKRQRSPSSDPDDLYSSPSAAKKSREDDKASSTSSFASSETLKSSSQPLTSGSSINSRHSSTPLEKNQGLSGFMIESTKFKRRRDGLNDSEGQRDDTVKAREEWFPEHPGLEDRSSELGHSSVIWTTAQNAELIRLRERVKPTPSWQQTAEALHRKFAKECMFKRMRESQPRNHYERMIKEEARTSHGHVSKNGIWAREEALAFLNKQEVKKQSAPTDNGYHKYTTAEDLEIIRLREVDMVNCTWDQVTDVFNKKFSRTTRTRRLWQSVVYGRYQKLKPESEQQEDKSDDSNNEDEAEEAREDWMPEHHVLGKSSLALTSVSWTTKEDAELLHLREQTRPKPSWRETAEVLNQNFHTRGMNATPHNYNNTRERWRHMKGENNFSAEGKALRQKALALLADDESVLQNSIPNPFTKREDAELVKLREVEMPNKPWAQLAVVFNAKLHPRLGDQTRSESTLHSRYQLLYSKWDEVAEDQSISILEFAQSGQIKSGTKVWTSAQDDELVHLRNTMPGKSWWDVAKAFNAHGETKGWPARTTRTIEKRFNAELKRAEDNKQYNTSTSFWSGNN
jgi:hypothetical protein